MIDDVAFVHRRDRAAVGSFGRDVRDHEAVRRAAEAAIGEQRHGVAKTRAHDGAGDPAASRACRARRADLRNESPSRRSA